MGSSCESGSSSSRRPSSERRDVAAVPGDAYQQVCVAPSSCLGGYRDSGDDEAPFEAATSQTTTLAGTAGLCEFELEGAQKLGAGETINDSPSLEAISNSRFES